MARRFVHGIRSRVSLLPIVLLLALMVVGVAACDNGPSLTPTLAPEPTHIPTVEPQKALSLITTTLAITMRDDWAGLSKASPIRAHYTLNRADDGSFTGLADFSAGDQSGTPVAMTDTITIPAGVMKDFLEKLVAIPLVEGEYTPKVEHTDDYPNIAITVQVSSDTVSYYTQSQGDNHVPWAISLANKTYVVDSPAIADAYALLTPYLKKDVLDKVVQEASNR